MRRFSCLCLVFLLAVVVSGCGRGDAPPKDRVEIKVEPTPSGPKPSGDKKPDGDGKPDDDKKVVDPFAEFKPESPEERARHEKYEAALAEALKDMADGKRAEALVALETARSFDDTEFIRGEIAKLKAHVDSSKTAARTVSDIETILDDGRGAEAAKLARAALRDFADDKETADRLTRLLVAAEALEGAGKKEDAADRFTRFKGEGDAALKEDNLRAAALAYESALSARDDAALRKDADALRAKLEKYDSLRARAAELRKDTSKLDEALDLLKEAKDTWKTLQVLNDIDECALALSKRREALSVAAFDVRGDVGIADAGKTVADELLPQFKARFDLVERDQLDKVIADLKIKSLDDDPDHPRAVAKLAKVKYLVLGSIRQDAGIVVNARLVDAASGLIVQTAKITVPDKDALWPALADLAKQLLMSDDEKAAFETERLRVAMAPEPVAPDAALPPAPAPLAAGAAAPPPLFLDPPPPPAPGGLKVDAFAALPPPPPPDKVLVVDAGGAAEAAVKLRFLHTTLLLGDNLFLRGHFGEARRHYELALALSPGNFDVLLRLDRVRPFLPVVVAVEPVVVVPPRPRVAVLNFLVAGEAWAVPPYLSWWTPGQLAPYLRGDFDVVDSGLVYWYMAKTGMTLNDLMTDPHARRWLGRALNIRYFVLGEIHQTASFDVNVFLLDAEFGFQAGRAHLHAHNPFELKLRLQELAQMLLLSPAERTAWLGGVDRFERLLVTGRDHFARRRFDLALAVFEDALRLRPRHVEVLVWLEKARWEMRRAAFAAEREREFLARREREEEARRRSFELARAAELERLRFAGAAPVVVEREAAALRLIGEARLALKVGNVALSISRFEGAVALAPGRDEYVRELALARAEGEKHRRLAALEAEARIEGERRRAREAELAKAQALLEKERLVTEARLAAERKAREAKDYSAYKTALDEGQRFLSKGDYDRAIAALQLARRYRKSDLVDGLLQEASVRDAEARAKAKGEAERLALAEKLAAEKTRRIAAEKEAKRNQDLYEKAFALAQDALKRHDYDGAHARFEEASRVFKTEAALAGIRAAESAKAKEAAERDAATKAKRDETERADRLRKLLADGAAFLEAKAYQKAAEAFRLAKGLAPGNLEALTGLTKAEQAEARVLADARRKGEEATRLKDLDRLVRTGQDNLKSKQFEAAVVAFQEALRLKPGDAALKGLLASAEKSRDATLADAKTRAAAKEKALAYQKLLGDGKSALAIGRFTDAIKSFEAAQKLLPGDKSSADYLSEARTALKRHDDEIADAAKKRADGIRRAADVKKAVDKARLALAAKDLSGAGKALTEALRLDEKNADALRLRDDLTRAEKAAVAAVEAEKARRAEFDKALSDARLALKAGRLDDAGKLLGRAETLAPKEPALLLARQDYEKARLDADAKAKGAAADLAARKMAYERAVSLGMKAFSAKKFDEALKAYGEALKAMPGDAAADRLLKDTQKAWSDLKIAEARKLADEKTDAEVQRLLKQADAALKGMRYDDARGFYGQALKLRPGLSEATKGLAEVARLSKGSSTKDDLESLLKTGADEERKGKWADALKTYQDAFKLAPKDARVTTALRRADFSNHMVEGQKYLDLSRFPDARREFEAALVLFPGNPQASKLLEKAKAGKK